MKKLVCALCLLLVFVCVFVGCEEETPNAPSNNDLSNEQTTQHTHALGEWSTTIPATCGAKGEEKRTCSCGESETRELAATGEHHYGEWSVSVQATCTTAGDEKRSCECGAVETRSLTQQHSFNEEDVCVHCQGRKAEIRLNGMLLVAENEYGKLYYDGRDGSIGYRHAVTDEIVFTNPARSEAVANDTYTADEMASQVVIHYWVKGAEYSLNSYADGFLKSEDHILREENGILVTYRMQGVPTGELVPRFIERTAFEQKILHPLKIALEAEYGGSNGLWYYKKFVAYYNEMFYASETREAKKEAIGKAYPVLENKNVDAYCLGIDGALSDAVRAWIEDLLVRFCPSYTSEELEKDHAFLKYEEEGKFFVGRVRFTMDENGLAITGCAGDDGSNGSIDNTSFGEPYPQSSIIVFPHLRALNSEYVHIYCQDQIKE